MARKYGEKEASEEKKSRNLSSRIYDYISNNDKNIQFVKGYSTIKHVSMIGIISFTRKK